MPLPDDKDFSDETELLIDGVDCAELTDERRDCRFCTGRSFAAIKSRMVRSKLPCSCREIIGNWFNSSPKFLTSFFIGGKGGLDESPEVVSDASAKSLLRSLLGSSLITAGTTGVG